MNLSVQFTQFLLVANSYLTTQPGYVGNTLPATTWGLANNDYPYNLPERAQPNKHGQFSPLGTNNSQYKEEEGIQNS